MQRAVEANRVVRYPGFHIFYLMSQMEVRLVALRAPAGIYMQEDS
jgi:hypothetical protein